MIRRPLRFFAALLLVAAPLAAAPPPAPTLAHDMKEVEAIRGVAFRHAVAHQTVARADLPAILRDQMQRTMRYSSDDYMLILRALQLVDGSSGDLMTSMLALYQDQVLAFYDPLTHVYFSVDRLPDSTKSLTSALGDSTLLQESVAVHELTHALQDQVYGAAEKHLALESDEDGEQAYHALLEGEASFVMIGWMMKQAGRSLDDVVSNDALLDALSNAGGFDAGVEAGTPRYFVESMKMPYVEGTKLVIRAYRRGGWKEVDRVHANPPRTTRELLHLDEYFARLDGKRPLPAAFRDVPPIDAPGLLTVEHLGEFDWGFLVGPQNARGWVDDRVAIVQDVRCEPTVLVETRWENAARAAAFHDAYASFLGGRGIVARVAIDGTTVRAAYGADAALMRRYIP